MRILYSVAVLVGLGLGVPAAAQVTLDEAFPSLSFARPVDLQAPNDGSGRLFVVEQEGFIRAIAPSGASASLFLGIDGRVDDSAGEMGLLGLAFHPAFPDSPYVYVNYTAAGPRRTVIARFSLSTADPAVADSTSEVALLEVGQPATNHNAGQLQFGPDGYLYVALGDGGGGGDPFSNGQDGETLLGSFLRLDVDRTPGGLAPDCGGPAARYLIPSDNPFVDGAGGTCDEAWALGFRNPWRFSFAPDGTLLAADVGQSAREEVAIVQGGDNHGWPIMEGLICYGNGCDPDNPSGDTLTVPVWDYDRGEGQSITGGYVYTGTGCAAELGGRYVYGDYISRVIWSLDPSNPGNPDNQVVIGNSGIGLSTFGVGPGGELYAADLFGGTLFRFVCNAALPVELAAFDVYADGGDAVLSWTTASEVDNAGFEVQHRPHGEAVWAPLGFVDGRGTTLEGHTYRFRAEGLPAGRHAFRLRQVDADGHASFSAEVEMVIEVAGVYALGPAYPNPFGLPGASEARLTLTLAEPQHVEVSVFDLLGRRVAALHDGPLEAEVPHTLRLDGAAWPSGLYLVRVRGETFVATRPVTLAR